MKDLGEKVQVLSGSLLLSHPSLLDPNFKQSVVLISAHTGEDGAMGVVINRPLGQSLGEFKDDFAFSPLAEVPIYSGGPVSTEQLILTAWSWDEDSGSFKLYFGISPDKAQIMMADEPDLEIRAFLGYAGWTGGQIETELKQSAWVVCPMDGGAIRSTNGVDLWKTILAKVSPELRFLADLPEDPSVN